MVRGNRHRRFKRGQYLRRPTLGRDPVRLPIVPRLDVHQRIGVKHKDIGILRKCFGDLAHCVSVSLIERCAVTRASGSVAGDECCRQRALQRCFGKVGRLHRSFEGARFGFGMHPVIDVGAQGMRLTPQAHSAVWIKTLRHAERAHRLGMVESPQMPQALVKPGLRQRLDSLDVHAIAAEARNQQWRTRIRRNGARCLQDAGREKLGMAGRCAVLQGDFMGQCRDDKKHRRQQGSTM